MKSFLTLGISLTNERFYDIIFHVLKGFIMNYVLEIFMDYTKRNRLLDEVAITRILRALITERNLEGDLSYVMSDRMPSDRTLGEYDYVSTIYMYYRMMQNRIQEKAYQTKFDKDYDFSSFEVMARKNLFILFTIFHEFGHVDQIHSLHDIYHPSLERDLYHYEINFARHHEDVFDVGILRLYLGILRRNFKYSRNYKLSFMERMANIQAFEEELEFLRKIGPECKNVSQVEKEVLDNYMSLQYKDSLEGPTTRFIKHLGYTKKITKEKIAELNQELPFEERFRYGFNLTEEEYQKIKK